MGEGACPWRVMAVFPTTWNPSPELSLAVLGLAGCRATVSSMRTWCFFQVPNLVILRGVVGRFSRCWRVSGGAGHHLRISIRAIIFYAELVVMLGFGISDRINAAEDNAQHTSHDVIG